VRSEKKKHINTLCGQNVELLNVNVGGKHSKQWVFNDMFLS
jgi:hypothetical protein